MLRAFREFDAGCLIPVGILAVTGGTVGAIAWLAHSMTDTDHLTDDEIQAGRPCTAVVLSVADTHTSINENTVYEVKLRVRPPDGAQYEATVRNALNSVEAGRAGAGAAGFRCVIDNDDASRVEVFWSE